MSRWPHSTYEQPWQVALRRRSACCVDPECELSGGYAHAGPCEPCECRDRHAVDECPLTRAPSLCRVLKHEADNREAGW